MATGTGKTVVMAMIIAWQTINKVMTPNDARFAKRFLVVTPGITIRDRLGVLHPERDDNYYHERDLVPADLWDALLQAQVEIINYHAFLPRDAKEIQGVAANTRKLLRAGKPEDADAFRETPDDGRRPDHARVRHRQGRDRRAQRRGPPLLPGQAARSPDGDADSEDQERNRDARVWFRGLCDLRRRAGIKVVYDLSATPYYLKGSGYNEGFIFPWVVSDFSLMDAIESGIVKIPRIPVDDDAAGQGAGLPAAVGQHPAAAAQAPRTAATGCGHRAAGLGDARGARGRAAQPLPQLRAELRPVRSERWPRSASRRRC